MNKFYARQPFKLKCGSNGKTSLIRSQNSSVLPLHWFCFPSLCDWSRKLATLSRPIRCKSKTNQTCSLAFSRAFGNLLCFCFTPLCDWSRKLVPLSQPIRCKTKDQSRPGRPRFRQFNCFYFEFLLALRGLFLPSKTTYNSVQYTYATSPITQSVKCFSKR